MNSLLQPVFRRSNQRLAAVVAGIIIIGLMSVMLRRTPSSEASAMDWHHAITATMFWVGEQPTAENAYISNVPSAWMRDWQAAYGGEDTPEARSGYKPAAFTPKENPFYFALPFSDHEDNGSLKSISVLRRVPWYNGGLQPNQSILKNRWIMVTYKDKTVYGQWEDVGPMETNDVGYVFGTAQPKYAKSGLDLSPAMNDYLGLGGLGKVSWRFVDEKDVPEGPWREIITNSSPSY